MALGTILREELNEFLTPLMKQMIKNDSVLNEENKLFQYAVREVNKIAPEEVSISWITNFIVTFPTNDKPAYFEREALLLKWLDDYMETADPDEAMRAKLEIGHLTNFIHSRFPSLNKWKETVAKMQ